MSEYTEAVILIWDDIERRRPTNAKQRRQMRRLVKRFMAMPGMSVYSTAWKPNDAIADTYELWRKWQSNQIK